jgi:hypothetical protein
MTDQQGAEVDAVPIPVKGVEMEVVENEVLLYHPQQTRAVYLNPTAAVVWGLCDGSRSVREIIRILGESYPEALATLTEDVLSTVNQLRESGVLVIA